ncbi:MAG: hypothetical protein ACRESZ_09130 [Methylococcales bacterium]
MRQTELHVTEKDRQLIETYRRKGSHPAREVNRAPILSGLDRKIPEFWIKASIAACRIALRLPSRWMLGSNAARRCIEWTFTRQHADQ